MIRKAILHLLFLLIATSFSLAQISYGGYPLPRDITSLRKMSTRSDFPLFVSLPSFDLQEQLRMDEFEAGDLRNGYRFAYKFITDYTPENSGMLYTLDNGTKVWRLGIHSEGALSLNLLFTTFRIPPGASLFIYDPDRQQILGSFNHLNKSSQKAFQVSPILSEDIIIEYQEPVDAPFKGEITIGEVNHGYRSFRISEPMPDKAAYWCMPPLACYEDTTKKFDEISQSVVLLIINGTTSCTGVLTNNTANDRRPFMLTASHCLNNQFTNPSTDYDAVAATLITYFNYNSPLCSPVEPGVTTQTMSSSYCRAINENTDMALLELAETPPQSYRPYYAGWNALDQGIPSYAGIHHPGGSVKRLNLCNGKVTLTSYKVSGANFDANAHWKIARWNTGCTAGGSSGSPLFDANNKIIGCLTGGASTCSNPNNDYYYALKASWDSKADSSKQLKCWLDPIGSTQLLCEGFDPYTSTAITQTTKNPLKNDTKISISPEGRLLNVLIEESVKSATLSIIRIDGRRVLFTKLNSRQEQIDLSMLASGFYIVQIDYGNHHFSQKIRI